MTRLVSPVGVRRGEARRVQGLAQLRDAQKPTSRAINVGLGAGALGGIRTPNLLIRSQMLYPLSYERRVEPEHFSATGHPFRNRFRREARRTSRRRCVMVPSPRTVVLAAGGAKPVAGGNVQVSDRGSRARTVRIVRLVTSTTG